MTQRNAYRGPERRTDHETRRQLDQMSREELMKILLTDALTGCLSARAFEEAESYRPARCYAVFDLDSLKYVNDTWGHQAGDALLQAFVQSAFEEGLLLYRTGGDEFCLRVEEDDWSRADLWHRLVRLQRRFRAAVFSWRDEAGDLRAATGAGCSFGFHPDRTKADAHLRRMKQLRTLAGTRSERGEKPRGLRLLRDGDLLGHVAGAGCGAA